MIRIELDKKIARLTYDLTLRNRDVEADIEFYKEILELEKAGDT